jgi:hypothetical protein
VRSPQPPLEYLVTCSQSCLEGFELARRDQISKLRAELRDIHEEWIEAEVAARLSRLLLDGRRTEIGAEGSPQSALDSMSSARQMSETPRPVVAFSGVGEKSLVSLFRSEQCLPGDYGSMHSPEAAALRPRHPESATLQLRPSSDVGSHAGAHQEPPKRKHAQPNALATNNSRQNIPCPRTSQRDRRSRRSVAGLRRCPAVDGLAFFRQIDARVEFVALRIRPSQQLPLFQLRENDRQTHGAHPTKTCEPNQVSMRVFVSGLPSSIPENLKALEQCSRSHAADLLPEQKCFLFLKSESTLRRDAVAAENTSARVPTSARRFLRAQRWSRFVSSRTADSCEGPPNPSSRFRRLIFRIPAGRSVQPRAMIVGPELARTGTRLPTPRNLSFFHYQTSCRCPS